MDRSSRVALMVVVAGLVVPTGSGAAPAPDSSVSPAPPVDLVDRIQAITDVVLARHVDPPTRQQMILFGIKALSAAAGEPAPVGLARRVSALAAPEQFAALLAETWPRSPAKAMSTRALEDALIEGLLGSLPGGASLISAKDLKVQEQVDGNLYVGIQIALGLDDKEKQPQVMEVFEGGPADRAGIAKGDHLEEINGVPTQGVVLREVIDRLRGEEGTAVVVTVRRPKPARVWTVTLTRARLPRPTIRGVRKRSAGGWDVLLDGAEPIGYLRLDEVLGSTPQELRQMTRQLEAEGARALILDLRAVTQARLHPTVLLADYLLDGGTIGRLRTADKVVTYQAEPDALVRDWPLAVLVDAQTSGEAEWLVAALQDNRRAVIVGSPTAGRGTEVRSAVPLPGGEWSVLMATGRLERGDGRALTQPVPAAARVDRVALPRLKGSPSRKGGITPDHLVGNPPDRSGRLGERPRPDAGESPDLANHPVVAKARQLLIEALKSTRQPKRRDV
jgi:carboxyl-terminal processing protease